MRLDAYLCANKFYTSRTKALQAIEKSQVTVNGRFQKPSYIVKDGDEVTVVEEQKFVSLGGYKLEKALSDFKFDVTGKTFVDVGASTGGFTHCLLLGGAKKVYALDVGKTQLDEKLKEDERVVVVDNTNARFVDDGTLPEKVDGAVVDCSFISLKLLVEPVFKMVKNEGTAIALIKPQFECGRGNLSKNGIVQDLKVCKDVCCDIFDYVKSLGLVVQDFTFAPLTAGKNIEFLIRIARCGEWISNEKISDIFDTMKKEKSGKKR
jgi:23S rRNA (cytidine1920-2'-O)/16S rRNA (cytidine1409-2'-O)-methyltransferase